MRLANSLTIQAVYRSDNKPTCGLPGKLWSVFVSAIMAAIRGLPVMLIVDKVDFHLVAGVYRRMFRSWRVVSLPVLLLVLAACSGPVPEPLHTERIFVFGTLVDISFWDTDEALRQQATARITQDFQRMHHEWHPWNPGPLVALNQALAEGQTGELPASLLPLLEHASQLASLSDNLFNPAIGGLLKLWGFQQSERVHGPPPVQAAIEAWLAAEPDMTDLDWQDGQISSRNPAVQLDFGAYAKGYAVDIAIEHLRELGIDNAIVNAGGDLRALGSKDGQAWRIGVQHPQGEDERLLAWLEIQDGEAVFTSGNYRRFRQDEGVRYSHILDPRTGWPVEGITSVTVLHPDNGALADAAATALVVAGVREWQRIAAQMGIAHVMLVDDQGIVYLSRPMAERVRFENAPARMQIMD